jgi:hypothetical protein
VRNDNNDLIKDEEGTLLWGLFTKGDACVVLVTNGRSAKLRRIGTKVHGENTGEWLVEVSILVSN